MASRTAFTFWGYGLGTIFAIVWWLGTQNSRTVKWTHGAALIWRPNGFHTIRTNGKGTVHIRARIQVGTPRGTAASGWYQGRLTIGTGCESGANNVFRTIANGATFSFGYVWLRTIITIVRRLGAEYKRTIGFDALRTAFSRRRKGFGTIGTRIGLYGAIH